MEYLDHPEIVSSIDDLRRFTSPYCVLSRPVIDVTLTQTNLEDDHLIQVFNDVIAHGVIVRKLNLLYCKYGDKFNRLVDKLSDQQCDMHLSLQGSSKSNIEQFLQKTTSHIKLCGLNVSRCRLDTSKIISICTKFEHLKCLQLDENAIHPEAAEALSSWLSSQGRHVTELSLKSCALGLWGGAPMSNIFSSLIGHNSLEVLDISGNSLCETVAISCILAIFECSSLRRLSLERVNLSTQTMFVLGFIVRWSSLQSLCLNHCSIGNDDIIAFNVGMKQPISGNMCESDSTYQPSEDVWAMCKAAATYGSQIHESGPQMVCLEMAYHRITDIQLLRPLFHHDVGLSVLDLSGCRMGHGEVIKLSAMLRCAQSLQKLSMNNCGVEGISMEALFLVLNMNWARNTPCAHPLVDISTGLWQREQSHFRSSGDDMRRGLTVVHGPPYMRVIPPISVLELENNRVGHRGASILSQVIAERHFHPLRILKLSGNHIGVLGFEAVLKALENDNFVTHFEIRKSDLVDDTYEVPEECALSSSSKLLYTAPWPLEKRFHFCYA